MLRQILKLTTCCAMVAGMVGFAGASRAQNEVKSATLDAVKKRGQLVCGVDTGIPGFAFQDASGKWQGLDIAYCRAIATAVLGDADKVKYVGTTSKVRFSVLQSGEIDVLIRDSTHTLTRNTELGLAHGAINFFTGEAFMVKKSLGVAHAKELNGGDDLRPHRHHARAQHRGFRARQQHQDQHLAVREAGGGLRRRRGRTVRRLHR